MRVSMKKHALKKYPSIVKSSIFNVNVKKQIQIFFKYHYKLIMNFIKLYTKFQKLLCNKNM